VVGDLGEDVGVMRSANLGLRFLLELVALAALAYWGLSLDAHAAVRVLLGVGAPLAAAVAWGMYVAPRARADAPPAARLSVELTVFALAIAALAASAPSGLAWGFAAVVVVNGVLTTVWRQRWYT
jgi:hypothetical protein